MNAITDYFKFVQLSDEVKDKFKICSTILWRWEKNGLIESRKIGNRSFYPESEIKRLISVEGGKK